MLKKAKTRLLTRAAQNRDCVFRGAYRAATVRETVPHGLFSSLLEILVVSSEILGNAELMDWRDRPRQASVKLAAVSKIALCVGAVRKAISGY